MTLSPLRNGHVSLRHNAVAVLAAARMADDAQIIEQFRFFDAVRDAPHNGLWHVDLTSDCTA